MSNHPTWTPCFAWLPVTTDDGQRKWLTKVDRHAQIIWHDGNATITYHYRPHTTMNLKVFPS